MGWHIVLVLLCVSCGVGASNCRGEEPKPRSCENLCDENGNCAVRAALLLPRNTSYDASLTMVESALELALQQDAIKQAFPDWVQFEWMSYDVEDCDAAYAVIGAIDAYNDCAHVFFGPSCDFALAAVARIGKFLGSTGTPMVTTGGFSYDFVEPKQNCSAEFYMLVRAGPVGFKDLAFFLIDIMKHFKWGQLLLITEPEAQVNVAGKSSCLLMMKSFANYLKKEDIIYTPWDTTSDAGLNYTQNLKMNLNYKYTSYSGAYEDDPVPLRVHDCSLDLSIVCRDRGVLCVMHHYLYKPLSESSSSLVLVESAELAESAVNFAYSVTVLRRGGAVVVHSVLPDLPWPLARTLRVSYTLYNDDHLLVHIPMLLTHLIDISPDHEPCCHIVLPCEDAGGLAPLLGWGPHAMVDLNTLDVVTLSVAEKDLVSAFKSTVAENKIAIVHYLVEHAGNTELAEELMAWLCVNQRPKDGDVFVRVMEEYLIASAFSLTRRSLPASAVPLLDLLPSVLHNKLHDVKVRDVCVSVSQEQLWCGASVVLAPRQRVCQFAEDAWTRLWRALSAPPPRRAEPQAVTKRLAQTMHCYQPEALSRGSTPLSPLAPGGGLGLAAAPRRASAAAHDGLPFLELDLCTVSRQEQVTAANLRAISTHLLRNASCGADGAHVHAAATRYVSAQLDATRALCRAACRAVGATTNTNTNTNTQQRGFAFIEEMDASHALIVYSVLEQYSLACSRVSFPLTLGFSSFFARLAHRALPFAALAPLVHRGALELQIDVCKDIVATKDVDERTVNNKLRLIQLIGEGRARRTLAAWPHRAALVLRAREHAAALLSGAGAGAAPRERRPRPQDHGIAALPAGERLSPLDTFLALLTAKASLNELDFNLIIEATLALVQDQH